jgi:hypothetical protein
MDANLAFRRHSPKLAPGRANVKRMESVKRHWMVVAEGLFLRNPKATTYLRKNSPE